MAIIPPVWLNVAEHNITGPDVAVAARNLGVEKAGVPAPDERLERSAAAPHLHRQPREEDFHHNVVSFVGEELPNIFVGVIGPIDVVLWGGQVIPGYDEVFFGPKYLQLDGVLVPFIISLFVPDRLGPFVLLLFPKPFKQKRLRSFWRKNLAQLHVQFESPNAGAK